MTRLRKLRHVRTSRQQPVSAAPAGTLLHGMEKPPEDLLSEQVYQSLKRDIVTGIHPPGEALSEKDLAGRYKSSRTPVREAAVRLQQDNLLRVVPNRGYFVTKISVQDLIQLYEYRATVECACAELAATKGMNPELMDSLEKLAQTEYKIDDRRSYIHFITADTAFHIGIAQSARNQFLLRAVETVRCQMERIMYAAIDIGYYGELPVREHCEILDAINNRDPQRARQLMYGHIFGSRDKVLRVADGARGQF
ncbi:MAG TPA: GntR family transcriptional regulator [Terriglobales bacterium]|nr:GntR family transcriptional regulator [Terriglobales bacterium]